MNKLIFLLEEVNIKKGGYGMKKRNNASKIVLFLLIAVVLTTCAISGTFAKYVSEATGSDNATVAKWSFKFAGSDIVTSDTFTIDLFKDSYIDGSTTYVDGNSKKVVAPGTTGSVSFDVENASQVLASYEVDFTVTKAAGIPIQFSTDNATWSTDLGDVAEKQLAIGGTDTLTIYWKWVTDTDAADTALGKDGTATITVEAKVTASQVVMP